MLAAGMACVQEEPRPSEVASGGAAINRPDWLEGTPDAPVEVCNTIRPALRSSEVGLESTVGSKASHFDFDFACAGETCAEGVGIEIEVEGRGSPMQSLPVQNLDAGGCWKTVRVDLSDYSGRDVEVRLRSRGGDEVTEPPDLFWSRPRWPTPAGPPNVILISVDTLRADRLGVYGHRRPTSPNIDALAADGVLVENAFSQSPWTTPSHMTMMTSLYPTSHGMTESLVERTRRRDEGDGVRTLNPAVPTLAQGLGLAGYRTAAITSGGNMAGELGFYRGFEFYSSSALKLDESVTELVEATLDGFEEEPFFLFFHTFEVHAPYVRPHFLEGAIDKEVLGELREVIDGPGPDGHGVDSPRLRNRMRRFLEKNDLFTKEVTSRLYDGGIRHADQFIGQMIESLETRGLLQDTLIVLTSDHGEQLGDRANTLFWDAHGAHQYDELTKVPLVFHWPSGLPQGVRLNGLVSLVDLAPTILDLMGIEVPPTMQGRSLRTEFGGSAVADSPDHVFSEATFSKLERKALRSADWKYVASFEVLKERAGIPGPLVHERLFDLVADPSESRTVHRRERERLEAMRRQLRDRLASLPSLAGSSTATMSEDTLERLRALGYLN